MRPSHAAGFVAMREAPLEQLASLPEQPLAIASLHMPPIRVAGLLLFGFAFPMPFPLLLLLGNVRAYFCVPQVFQQRSAMVALVAHHLFDAFRCTCGFWLASSVPINSATCSPASASVSRI